MSREMKESGAPWMGRIPQTWRTERFKHCFNIIGGNGFAIDQQGREMGDYPFAKAGDIASSGTYLSTAANYVTDEQVKAYKYNVIPAGSILFPKIGEALKKNNRSISEVDCCIDNNCQAAIPTKCDTKFAYYLLSVMDMKWYDNSGTIPSVNNNKLKNETIPFPSEDEQKVVAQFLDTSCATIDSAISKHQQIIEKLEEYRKAVISQAVTKGLNPNAEMKETDEPWIGKMPASWLITKLKYGVKQKAVKATDKTTKYIGLENIESWTGKYITTESESTGEAITYEKGDVLFGKLRPYLAKAMIATDNGRCTSECLVLKPVLFTSEYLQYAMLSETFINRVDVSTYGAKMPRANWLFIGNLLFPQPSVVEQKEIVSYLNDSCTTIDAAIAKHNQLISKLQEYKQSLIYNAVTGKIDCRTEA